MICIRCGMCCTLYQAQLSLVEAQLISHGLGLALKIFTEKYADPRWPGTRNILLRQDNGACVFLVKSGGQEHYCSIQRIKPLRCRRFKASLNRKECRDGLLKYWQLSASPAGELSGDEDKLRRYYAFLASLE